ncbi:MAG TPA: helix-turn-helix domain-containing protein [Microthrixaceae bacterium]|nr:helix-turn-helix domain-containing protein [Microthrixaceae bacterium]
MRRSSFADMHCSVAQSLEQIGEWWTLLILRDALLGVRRFEDFQSRLGIARNVLSARLDTLVRHGIMERRAYSERPPRHEYVLTEKGKDLWPVMTALRQWGDRWAYAPGEHPVVLVHDTCGNETQAVPTCSECGEELTLRSIHVEPGPGALPGFVPSRPARQPAGE